MEERVAFRMEDIGSQGRFRRGGLVEHEVRRGIGWVRDSGNSLVEGFLARKRKKEMSETDRR